MYPVEVVTWNDAGDVCDGWTAPLDIPCEPIEIKSVGYLVKEDDLGLVIAMDLAADGDLHGASYIPKSIVTSRVRLS